MDIIGESLLCLQNEARKLNHQEVVAEDQRKKLPSNWEAKRQRIDWEEEEETRRKVRLGRNLRMNSVLLLCYRLTVVSSYDVCVINLSRKYLI